MIATKNYTARSPDFLIFQGTAPSGETKLRLGLGGDTGGLITTGIQKLAQLWTVLFLTELGSIPSAPTVGTEFIVALRIGSIRDENDVQTAFSRAARRVIELLRLREKASDLVVPDDEKIGSTTLLSFTLDPKTGTLSLKISLVSLAGTTHDIILPIPVPIQ